MTNRYMSAIQSAPSGPVLSMVGRNQLSARSQEFAAGLARTALAAKARAPGLEHDAVDQVVHRLADEHAGRKRRTEKVVAVGSRAVRRSDMVGHVQIVEPCKRAADRVQSRLGLEHLPRIG